MPISENVKQEKITSFWQWFTENQDGLRSILKGKYDLIDHILNELIKIQRGLAVEFEGKYENIIMTISADGILDNFEIVEQLIAASPKLPKWTFIGFRQRVSSEQLKNISVRVQNVELRPEELLFLPITESSNLYIQIFYEGLTQENEGSISYGTLMLLDNIIGEYDCVKKVAGYEFYDINAAQDFQEDLRPLIEMRDYLND